jgi:hypothetical protein
MRIQMKLTGIELIGWGRVEASLWLLIPIGFSGAVAAPLRLIVLVA